MKIDKLFKLIKALSGTEKRYFSVWCTRPYGMEKNIALQLFAHLQRQKHYDQKEFLATHKQFAYAKNFRFNKHFLFNQLLRCLHSFHSGRNIEAKLKEMLDHAEILSEKGLMEESMLILKNAAELALKYECFGIYYELKRKELEFFRDVSYKGVDRDRILKVENEIGEALRLAADLAHTESTIMQLLQALAQGGIQRGAIMSQAKKLIKTLKPLKREDHFRTSLLHYQGMGAIGFSKGDFADTWKWTGKVLRLFDRFDHMKSEKKKTYLVSVQNHLVASNYLNKYGDLETVMNELKNVKADTPQLRNRIFYMTHNMMLGTCAHVGDFVQGLKLIREIKGAHKKGTIQHLNRANELILEFNSALVYFGTGRYKEANAAVNTIIDAEQENVRQDLHSFARIFLILIQFDSGKQELLEYSVRSAYRFLLKKKKLFEVEKVIIQFLRNSAHHMNTSKERMEAFAKLKKELEHLKNNKSEEQLFRFFDLIAWLDSKLTGKYFGTILREKYPEYWKGT